MTEPSRSANDLGWSRADTRRRQRRSGSRMSHADRLAWLEEMLDELLPLVGRARLDEQTRNRTRS